MREGNNFNHVKRQYLFELDDSEYDADISNIESTLDSLSEQENTSELTEDYDS